VGNHVACLPHSVPQVFTPARSFKYPVDTFLHLEGGQALTLQSDGFKQMATAMMTAKHNTRHKAMEYL